MDEQKNDWKRISQEEAKNYSPEKILKLNASLIRALDRKVDKIKKKNQDCVGVVQGKEGSGKSNIAGNIMRYISKDKFDPKKHMIGSDYADALDKIEKVPHGGFLMFDEGNVFFMSTNAMTRESRDLHEIFSIFRQKNLFVVICLPSFFRLNSYFAVDRSSFVITTYYKDDKKGSPWRFAYYSRKVKDQLYALRGDFKKRNQIKANIRSTFSVCEILQSDDYKDFKLETLNASIRKSREKVAKKTAKPLTTGDVERHLIKQIVKNNPDKTSIELGQIVGKTPGRVRQIRMELKKEEISANVKRNQVTEGGVKLT